MFKKLHLRLTLLCSLASGLILIIMSLICLSFSEAESRESHFADFQIDINMLINYLESQSVISHNWLSQFYADTRFQINIQDNGSTLVFEDLNSSSTDSALFAQARRTAKEDYLLFENSLSSGSVFSAHKEFELSSGGRHYYASVALIPKNNGVLNIAVLHTPNELYQELLFRRLLFAAADILGVFLLVIFFWFFSWRMIQPLIQNRQKQAEFIASASHELRSPLTVMLSCLSAMQHAPSEDARHFSEIITLEGKRMSRLIDDMLTLSGTDGAHFSIHKTAVEFDTLLLSAYEKFEPLARKKCVSLRVDLPETLVPACRCDRERIEQVLSILLDNAISYTPSQGKITLSLETFSDKILIRVADTGIGIPDSEKKAVFDRFYRCDKSHKDKSHFGLGLSIAWEIIHLHKGRIKVEDTPGGGTTFTLLLKL